MELRTDVAPSVPQLCAELRKQLSAASVRISEMEAASAAAVAGSEAFAQREAYMKECLQRGDAELARVRAELESRQAGECCVVPAVAVAALATEGQE